MKVKVVKTILSVLIDVISVILPFLSKAESDGRSSRKKGFDNDDSGKDGKHEQDSTRIAE